MNLADALLPLLPAPKGVIAFVGAGGKTSALFRLAEELRDRGHSVLVTTTTHFFDPRLEPVPIHGDLAFRPEMEAPCPGGGTLPAAQSGLTVLVSREADQPGKVKGIHASWVPALRPAWDFLLVEADGSRRLPVKAPALHEPVIPEGTDLVAGVMGLDCLGRPMNADTVHRPERFTEVTGCGPSESITWDHLSSLARHPHGLFKGAPGARAVLLNKADMAFFIPSRAQLLDLAADRVVLCCLGAPEPVITFVQRAP